MDPQIRLSEEFSNASVRDLAPAGEAAGTAAKSTAKRAGGARQVRQKVARDQPLYLRCSEAEKERVRELANERGVSMTRLLMDALRDSESSVEVKAGALTEVASPYGPQVAIDVDQALSMSDVRDLRKQVRGIAQNVNQQTVYSHQEEAVKLRELQVQIAELMRLFDSWLEPRR